MKNKKGQFFLIAALIIITILLSFVTYRSRVKIIPVKEKVYDIGEELTLETAEVLDYGIYTGRREDIGEIFESWVANFTLYQENIGQDFIFIYSDPDGNIKGFSFTKSDLGEVSLTMGETPLAIEQEGGQLTDITGLTAGEITITLEDFSTTIDYQPGERDFYFVLRGSGGEIAQTL